MAILSAVLLAAGVLRHYIDIYQTRSVRGISFLFVGIDAMGDLTSLLSLGEHASQMSGLLVDRQSSLRTPFRYSGMRHIRNRASFMDRSDALWSRSRTRSD